MDSLEKATAVEGPISLIGHYPKNLAADLRRSAASASAESGFPLAQDGRWLSNTALAHYRRLASHSVPAFGGMMTLAPAKGFS